MTGMNPGSEFGEWKGLNPGLAGSKFGEKTGPNPGSEFGFTVWRKEPAEPWFGSFEVRRKNLAKPWFRVWVRSKDWANPGVQKGTGRQVQSSEK